MDSLGSIALEWELLYYIDRCLRAFYAKFWCPKKLMSMKNFDKNKNLLILLFLSLIWT
jgi:uncharacterized protein (UPF0332 family)